MASKRSSLVLTKDNGQRLALLALLRERVMKKGTAAIARDTGIPQTHLYTLLGERGNPTLESLFKLTAALRMKIEIR